MSARKHVANGSRFGYLTVIRKADRIKGLREASYRCECRCGRQINVTGKTLRKGKSRSCGCKREKHGHATAGATHPLYMTWKRMRQRCMNPNYRQWKDYGGRGITVCERWERFSNYAADIEALGPKPGPDYTLDRIDNEGNYEPGNMRWATRWQQTHNRRNSTALASEDGASA